MKMVIKKAALLNQDVTNWDVSDVTDMSRMFYNAISFNQNMNNWNVSNVTNMNDMFCNAISFNQDIGGWDVSNVTNMNGMFYNAISFDQNIGNWNISEVTDMNDMFKNVTLSTANYDALLIGWAAQSVKPNVNFHAGNSKYTPGGAAEVARNTLTGPPNNWTITDGGPA